MEARKTIRETPLTALLVAPNRGLAEQFCATLPLTRAFQILADLRAYPHRQTLDIRLKQLKPDVVLLDVGSDPEAAGQLISQVAPSQPPVHVIGLHTSNDPELILGALRQGASEFLYSPFEVEVQREAVARIRRLKAPESAPPELGRVVVFCSTKPGSGATTLATQTAFALRRVTGKRILLADLDLMGGTIGFCLKLNHNYSVVDALEHAGSMDPALWSMLTASYAGFDVLPSPDVPAADAPEPSRLHDVLEYARMLYDWVIVDLPSVFHRVSLLTLSESDTAFLVTTSELPSLHLTRKAVNLLGQIGFDRSRFQVVVNRVNKNDNISGSDMERVVNCPVYACFPNDYFSLHRVVTLGQALGGECELGKSMERLAGKLAGVVAGERRRAEAQAEPKPVLLGT